MPSKCCVPGCRSNYAGEKEYVTVFKLPSAKRADVREKWMKNILRKDFVPSSTSVVCRKHFREEDIITYDKFTDSKGVEQTVYRTNPALREGAYPTIFPLCNDLKVENNQNNPTSQTAETSNRSCLKNSSVQKEIKDDGLIVINMDSGLVTMTNTSYEKGKLNCVWSSAEYEAYVCLNNAENDWDDISIEDTNECSTISENIMEIVQKVKLQLPSHGPVIKQKYGKDFTEIQKEPGKYKTEIKQECQEYCECGQEINYKMETCNLEMKNSYMNAGINLEDRSCSKEAASDAESDIVDIQKGNEKNCRQCDIDCAGFSYDIRRIYHNRVHLRRESYECDVCGEKFTTSPFLQRHKRLHSRERPFKCEVCGAKFSHINNLKIHNKKHTGDKFFLCDICGEVFAGYKFLLLHNRKHAREKPYKCDVCGAKFAKSESLTSHEKTHTGEKPYKCDLCDARFSNKQKLDTHDRVHTGEKPFLCEICGSRFPYHESLVNHRRIHSGVKPFQCDVCSASFVMKRRFMFHKRKHIADCGKGVSEHRLVNPTYQVQTHHEWFGS